MPKNFCTPTDEVAPRAVQDAFECKYPAWTARSDLSPDGKRMETEQGINKASEAVRTAIENYPKGLDVAQIDHRCKGGFMTSIPNRKEERGCWNDRGRKRYLSMMTVLLKKIWPWVF